MAAFAMADQDAQSSSSEPARKSGYELSDISTRVVVVFATALAVAGLVIHVLVWLLYVYFGHVAGVSYSRQYPLSSVGPAPLPPAPMLQVKPHEDLVRLRADEDALLNSYGWVDAANGIVRIPIDRAMQLVLERGLPVRGAGGAPAGAPDAAGTAQQGAASGPARK